VTASSSLAHAHPNQEFSAIIHLGHKASDLAILHQTVLDPRLPPNTRSTLIDDLDLLGVVVPGAKQARLESRVATADQDATLHAGYERIQAVRIAVKKARTSKEVKEAYSVGHFVNPRVVRDVKAVLKMILDRATANPGEAASIGIVQKDLDAITAVHQAITDADKAQEQQRARAPLSTQDRNRTANRILEAVARIAGAGGLEFANNPEVRAAFRALKPPPKTRKVAPKKAPDAPSLNA
jgi:hypothetical protein